MPTVSCKFCTKYVKIASNVTQMKEHLKICIPYLEDISNAESWIVDEHNRKRQKSDTSAVLGLGGRKRQATLEEVLRLSKQNQDETTRLAAMALHRSGKSFNTFEDESWAAWCHKMNLTWKIPSANCLWGYYWMRFMEK